MSVTVIGCGYVGLSTGLALALVGNRVNFIDIDANKIAKLRQGEPPFYEPGLAEALAASQEQVCFYSDYDEALKGSRVIVIAVATPATPSGSANLSYLYQALQSLGKIVARDTVIVLKSTVPVGTNRKIAAFLREKYGQFSVVSNPEFLRQGSALFDSLYPDRIVIGAENEAVIDVLQALYQSIITRSFESPDFLPLPKGKAVSSVPFINTTWESAELAKYAANAFLATKISFANEMANVCDALGADIEAVVEVIGLDPRIGPHFLRAGLGYGGSCFPKDTRAISYISNQNGYHFKLLNAVIEVNNAQRYNVVAKLEEILENLAGKRIALLGLTFKPGTDDLRDAPSIDIANELILRGAQVCAHDPMVGADALALVPSQVTFAESPIEALTKADAAIIVTEWPIYKEIDWQEAKEKMTELVVIDGRNLLEPSHMRALGFTYRGVGR